MPPTESLECRRYFGIRLYQRRYVAGLLVPIQSSQRIFLSDALKHMGTKKSSQIFIKNIFYIPANQGQHQYINTHIYTCTHIQPPPKYSHYIHKQTCHTRWFYTTLIPEPCGMQFPCRQERQTHGHTHTHIQQRRAVKFYDCGRFWSRAIWFAALSREFYSAELTIGPAFLPSGLLSFFHLVGGSIAYTECSERKGRWLSGEKGRPGNGSISRCIHQCFDHESSLPVSPPTASIKPPNSFSILCSSSLPLTTSVMLLPSILASRSKRP